MLQVSRKLVRGGGIDAGRYDPNCTHVIVDKLVYVSLLILLLVSASLFL